MLTIKIPMLSNFSLGLLVCTNRINDKIEQDNKFKKDVTIWIITEWDRSVTTILFPNEY
jgi:hypothetical protein